MVDRIDSIWPYLNKIDVFIFPDLYHGPLQKHLDDMGVNVWGSRMGENLELYRETAKDILTKLGIDIGPYVVIEGTADLRKYLKSHKDKFIKVSKTRGDFETFHHEEFGITEPWLDELEYRIGPKKTFMRFIVEDAIEPAIEVGFDGYCIDGKFSDPIVGVEIKDLCILRESLATPDDGSRHKRQTCPFVQAGEVPQFLLFRGQDQREQGVHDRPLLPYAETPWIPLFQMDQEFR